MAIARYLARKYNMDGRDDLAVFASSENLTEEARSIYDMLMDAQFGSQTSVAGYAALFSTILPPHLQALEALLGDGTTFHPPRGALLGDCCIYAVLSLVLDIHPTLLRALHLQRLDAFCTHMHDIADMAAAIDALPRIFTAPA